MRELHVDVRNKIATYNARDGVIVCGNNDYKIKFSFDEEWSEYPTKTARFIWRGRYYDQEFTGDECQVPIINDTTKLTVGVYVGELRTTTPAKIPCLISILCGEPEIVDENVKEYRDKAQEAAEQAVRAAAVLKNPTIDVVEIEGGHRLTIHDVDGDKPFYVMNGKNGGADGVGIAKAEINANGELILTYTNGNTANLGKVVGGSGSGLTDEQLKQFNTLVQWHADSTYTPMTVTIKQPGVRTYEIGSRQDLTFKWEFSHDVDSVTFDGATQTVSKTGSATVYNITESKSYTVSGTRKDEKKESASDTVQINFYNKYYFGCAPEPTVIDSDFIKRLTLRTDWASEKPTFTETPFVATEQYVWYACPVDYAPSSFKMGGFSGGFTDPQLVSYTNGSGHTENYYLYRSVEAGLGSIEIQVL